MDSITQDMRFRLSLILYAEKYGVSKAARKYKTNRQYVYRWLKRYDGSWSSLRDRSRRPHHHPNEHTPDELKLIRNMRRRNPNAGLVVFWVKLRQRGYSRSITGLFRVLRRLSLVSRSMSSMFRLLVLSDRLKERSSISSLPLTSSHAFVTWKHLKNAAHMLQRSSWIICWMLFLLQLNVSRQITVWSSPNASATEPRMVT